MSDDQKPELLGSKDVAARYDLAESTGRKLFWRWLHEPDWIGRYKIRPPRILKLSDGTNVVSEKELTRWEERLLAAGAPLPNAIPRGRRPKLPAVLRGKKAAQ